ncbi:MAG TPA: DUF4097 family beta strand repeat-containing protein [Steroidobacteraceae bacterium]|jgi:hypothetical protein
MLVRATLAAFAVLLASAPATAAEKKLDRSFTVAEGGRLTIDADGSDVTVSGTDSNQVVVNVIVKGSEREIDRTRVEAEQSGNDVTVQVKRDRGNWLDWFQWSGYSKIDVKVPRSYHVEIDTSGGDLAISHLKGEVRGKTSGGDLKVSEVVGPVYMRTSGGDIEIDSIEGDTDIKTSGGDIEARKVLGSLTASTSGGSVDLIGIDGAVNARTSGGSVRIELSGSNRGVSANTSGGDIVLRLPRNVSATVDVSTGGGSIRTDLPVTTSEFSETKLKGTINGGGAEIHARTLGGDVRLLAADGN